MPGPFFTRPFARPFNSDAPVQRLTQFNCLNCYNNLNVNFEKTYAKTQQRQTISKGRQNLRRHQGKDRLEDVHAVLRLIEHG